MNLYEAIEEEIRSYIFKDSNDDLNYIYLVEERGIANEVQKLTDIISEYIFTSKIKSEKRRCGDTIKYSRLYKKIDVGDDFYMIKPTVLVNLIIGHNLTKGESSYIVQEKKDIVNNKLYNPIFIIEQYNVKTTLNKELFLQSLSHEIMHSYRTYKILTSNPNADEERRKQYGYYSNFLKNDNEIVNMIKKIYYLTDNDEITVNFSTMANYVIRNKYINFLNYKHYLSEIPYYNKIQEMAEYGDILRYSIKNKMFVNAVGNIISNTIYDNKLSPQKAFNKTLIRLDKAYQFCTKQFYKILFNVLQKENRPRKNTSPTDYTTEDIKRILLDFINEKNFHKG